MKSTVQLALTAALAVGVAAQPHNHQHAHLHKKHQVSPVEKRAPDVVTEYAVGPTVTVYELGGEEVSQDEAQDGIDEGLLVIVGESSPSFSPPPPPAPPSTSSTSTPSPKSTVAMAAQFFEKPKETTSSSSSAPPKPTQEPKPTTTAKPSPPKTTASPSSGGGSGSEGGKGLDKKFPSGKVKCSEFPSDYGAIPVDYLGTKGWVGIQKVPNYSLADKVIDYIVDGVNEGCSAGSFCSYACPAGYQKTQWPSAQGDTLQSIGGLYCNDDGYLELSRKEHDTLCEQGAGGVWVQNDLDDISCVCRTDYPGNEAMVIPTIPQPGEKLPLTNPYAPEYYVWNDMPTTAQYYVNKKGYKQKDACVWDSKLDPKGAGNWAPINVGTGKAEDGNTYISIFPNWPTSDDVLDFNIEILGDTNSKCALIDGKFVGGSETGCTTTLSGSKGEAVIRFYSGKN